MRRNCLRTDAPVTPAGAGVGERVDDFVVIRRGAYSLGHDKKFHNIANANPAEPTTNQKCLLDDRPNGRLRQTKTHKE